MPPTTRYAFLSFAILSSNRRKSTDAKQSCKSRSAKGIDACQLLVRLPAFAVGIGLNTAFVIIEGAFGSINSMALIADAGHNLSGVLELVVAWVAAWRVLSGTNGPPLTPFS